MQNDCYELLEADLKAIDMLRDFIPAKVFDAHCHLYTLPTIPASANETEIFTQEMTTLEDYLRHMRPFFPGAEEIRLNLIPMPDPIMREQQNGTRNTANQHVLKQLERNPKHVGSVYVLMDDSEQIIGDMVSKPGIAGLKCYCYAANTDDYNSCTIDEYLPEAAWVVSNQTGIPIILHLMKPKALSDTDNLAYIKAMCKRYPNANLVLAHCARGFAAWTVIDAIKEISGFDNVWFDLSAICESAPMASCIMQTAGKRVMWGSDYPMSMYRGRIISINTGFLWLTNEAVIDLRRNGLPVCAVAAENLLAFRQACVLLGLDKTQIDDLFYNNAMSLFFKRKRECSIY